MSLPSLSSQLSATVATMPKNKTQTTSANMNTIDVLKPNLVEQPMCLVHKNQMLL